MNVTINEQQRVFVRSFTEGYSTLGFDHAWDVATAVSQRLNRPELAPLPDTIGTLAGYAKYQAAIAAWGASALAKTTWFDPGTAAKVAEILERYRASGKLLRLFYGDPATGRDWMEECDTVGTIGRSGGLMRSPLLVAPGVCGGPAILTACIVRMLDGVSGRELYRADTYVVPALTSRLVTDEAMRRKGLTFEVIDQSTGTCVARFRRQYEAVEYIAFMTGEIPVMREHLCELVAA